jgi:predicted Zn-dependent protease
VRRAKWIKIFGLAIILTGAAEMHAKAQSTPQIMLIDMQAVNMSKSSQLPQAKGLLLDKLKQYPGNSVLTARLGQISIFQDDEKAGRKLCTEALQSPKADAYTYDIVLDCYNEIEDPRTALPVAQKGIRLFPNDPALALRAGKVFKDLGMRKEATQALRAGVLAAPANLGGWENLVANLAQDKDWAGLIAASDDLIAISKKTPGLDKRISYARIMAMRADALTAQQKWAQARQSLDVSIKISPLDRRLFAKRLELDKKLKDRNAQTADEAKIKSLDANY